MEAARAYGASDTRLVTRYLIPRVLPIVLPKLIILVPSFVFLEATLAYVGISDPVTPTWGKLLVEALSSSVYHESYHAVLAPFVLLFLVGFAFAMIGLALERIFDPRLREM
jgi:peptide/nickel transport system permease protein